tara:strand:- start:41 stop:460 length:420 start_codon:yes stop_codon:yes gene_type:complete
MSSYDQGYTCIECLHSYSEIDGDLDERMCNECLYMIDEQKKQGNNQENNKLIAEFMGWKPNEHHWCLNGDKDLQYHTSWDWLMPVVRKIVDICCNDDDDNLFLSDEYTSILDTVSCAVIQDSHKVVVEFIQDYNKGEIK